MIRKIIDYFTIPYKQEDYLKQQTAKALTVISLLGIILALLYLIQNLFLGSITQDPINFLFTPIAFSVCLLISLILIKKSHLKFAGNFLITSLIIIEIFVTISSLHAGSSFIFSFSGTFYYFLMLLSFGFFFATNEIITLNVILVLISSIVALKIAEKHVDPDTAHNLEIAITDFITNLIAIYAMLMFSKKVIKIAFQSIQKEKAEKEQRNRRLSKILNNIQHTIEQLTAAGENLTLLSEKISERSRQQAATTEEVAASTEEISSTIENTAQLAQKTHTISSAAEKDILKAAYVLEDTINIFMEISEHISVINNIAEKTDILAINASIEAAHAGEYGKGFAVVAQEIRKLSDTAKSASDKISALISESQHIAALTKEQTNNIVYNIRDILKYMENIVSASQEQLQSISQITSSTSQLSTFAEENAAIAQQLNEASHKLNKLSKSLIALISK